MTIWVLDTNMVSMAVHRRSASLDRRLEEIGPARLRVSAISYGEVKFGLARKPEARRLAQNIADFFQEIAILPWTEATAEAYGNLRARLQRAGKSLSPLDMLIAAHALEAGATLVSNDRAFRHVPDLEVEDWTTS